VNKSHESEPGVCCQPLHGRRAIAALLGWRIIHVVAQFRIFIHTKRKNRPYRKSIQAVNR
jgi:hypothetical protein